MRNIHKALVFLFAGLCAISPGLSDDNILCVQQRLTAIGLDAGPLDGAMGQRTRNAAEQWLSGIPEISLPPLSSETAGAWCANETFESASWGSPLQTAQGGFWVPPEPADRNAVSSCLTGNMVAELPYRETIYGQQWPDEDRLVATRFVEAVTDNVARALSTPAFDVRAFAELFVAAADAGAFTQIDFEEDGGPSPVFSTSMVLIASSYVVELLDQREAWLPGERDRVLEWGNQIEQHHKQKRVYASPDSVAAIANARMAWGAATEQQELVDEGLQDFMEVAEMLHGSGIFEQSPRDNNEDVSMMVAAAETAMRNGINVYAMKFNGISLHQAVSMHAAQSLELGPVQLVENDNGTVASYFRPHGFAAHMAWIPIYLSRFQNTEAAALLLELKSAIQTARPGPFHGQSLGGRTGCYWANGYGTPLW